LRELYQQFRLLIHEGSKFLVVGGCGFVITLGGFDLLHYEVGQNYYLAVTLANLVATVVTFVGNRYWTFTHRQRSGAGREAGTFFLLNAVATLFQYGSIAIVTEEFGQSGRLWVNLANLVGICLGTLFRFWSYRKWVWAAGADPAISTAGGSGGSSPRASTAGGSGGSPPRTSTAPALSPTGPTGRGGPDQPG
jgi:putative flippase GtrA